MTYPPTSIYDRYTPHSVTISAPGLPTETKAFTMDSSQEATIILDGSASEPPVISNVAVSNVSQTGATISWQTDRAADSKVEYGLDATYGATLTDAGQVTSHSMNLSGLSPNTYHYRVTSTDSSGSYTVGADHTFTILPTLPGQRPLLLTKSMDKTAPHPGEMVTYTISYSNTSQLTVTNAHIVDTVPTNTTYIANSASNGGTYDGAKITWSLGDLAPGATGSVTFQVTVN